MVRGYLLGKTDMNLLKSYLDIKGKKLHIAKLRDTEEVYFALADLIDCSLNQKNNNEILSLCIKKGAIKILFTGENNFYISECAVIEILMHYPSHMTEYIISKISSCKEKKFFVQVPKIIKDFEYKCSMKKGPSDFWQRSDGENIPIYEINDFHTLVQFLGYGKYINRNVGNVYYRGQASLYPIDSVKEAERILYKCNLIPSIYRPGKNGEKLTKINLFYEHIKNVATKIACLSEMPTWKLTPLLQHYGFKTNWLDVVDNVWIALWFASHEFNKSFINNQEIINICKSEDKYAYLLLITSDAITEDIIHPGYFIGQNTTVVDLRKALPSTYLRPHAQHALMLRKNDIDISKDYSDLIVGIAKIPIHKTTDWLGRSGLLSVQSLFPSPYYDFGYRKLLEEIPKRMRVGCSKCYGSIQLISHDFF